MVKSIPSMLVFVEGEFAEKVTGSTIPKKMEGFV